MFDSGYEILLIFITFFTISLQLYVIYLVQMKSPSGMKDYRYFLTLLSMWDIAFSICLGLIEQPYPLSSSCLAISTRGFCTYFGPFACHVAAAGGIYCGSLVLMGQIYCLIYRFCTILTSKRFYALFMSLPSIVYFWIQSQVIAVSIGFFFYKALIGPEEIANHSSINWADLNKTLIPNDIVLFIDISTQIAQSFMWTTLILIAFSEILSISLIYGILSYLHKHSSLFSKSNYKLNLQLTGLLGIQLLSPLVLLVIPAVLYVYALFHKISVSQFSVEIGFLFLMSYGVMNGFLTIVLIGPYRFHAYQQLIRPILKPFGLASQERIIMVTTFTQKSQMEKLSRRRVTF